MKQKLPLFQRFSQKTIDFRQKKPDFSWRIFIFSSLIVISFLVIILRLFNLTIVKGNYFRYLAEKNRLREIYLEAPRGKIFDRKGFVIAYSAKSEKGYRRVYPEGESFAHLLGYRQIADKTDLKNDLCQEKLSPADKTGKMGVEKLFDCQLRGKKGKKIVEVDAYEKILKTLTIVSPIEGKSLKLSVDMELQKKAYSLIKEKEGAVVATKPQTGEILVLVSSPSFNPQDFEDGNQSMIKKYFQDKNQPLFNRATKGLYPPGSTIKPMLAAGFLEEKVIDEKFQIDDPGIIKAGPLTFGNWYFLEYGKTDGMVDVIKAIYRSNDIFFYQVGAKMGEERIKLWLEKFGFGKKTKIGLDEEEGLIPSPFWKKETLKENWYLGDTYNLSIGQGYFLATPLQVNLATAVFANGGYWCQPQLLKIDSSGFASSKCFPVGLSKKTLEIIKEGMKKTCSFGGTGWPFFDFKIQTACKTGTAESSDKNKKPHAWFTVFAPFDNPEIVLTVLVEHKGQGADVAGPIAKEVLKAYFEREE